MAIGGGVGFHLGILLKGAHLVASPWRWAHYIWQASLSPIKCPPLCLFLRGKRLGQCTSSLIIIGAKPPIFINTPLWPLSSPPLIIGALSSQPPIVKAFSFSSPPVLGQPLNLRVYFYDISSNVVRLKIIDI